MQHKIVKRLSFYFLYSVVFGHGLAEYGCFARGQSPIILKMREKSQYDLCHIT
jgi:hypothetical protein